MKRNQYRPEARMVNVITVEFRRGKGVDGDPMRMVTAYYSTDGELLAERDEWAEANETAVSSAVKEGNNG